VIAVSYGRRILRSRRAYNTLLYWFCRTF